MRLLELRREGLEVVEVQVLADSPAAGKRVAGLSLPEGSRLVSVMRNGVARDRGRRDGDPPRRPGGRDPEAGRRGQAAARPRRLERIRITFRRRDAWRVPAAQGFVVIRVLGTTDPRRGLKAFGTFRWMRRVTVLTAALVALVATAVASATGRAGCRARARPGRRRARGSRSRHGASGDARRAVRRRAGRARPRRRGRRDPAAAVPRPPRHGPRGRRAGAARDSRSPPTTRRAASSSSTTPTTNGNTRVVRYRSDGAKAVPASARQLLFVKQPYANHNGGMVAYGKDGLLYVGMGDGGSGGDPENRAQNPSSLLGKILRLDPARPGAKPVTVALGVRNPWRFSFDRATGDLWVGDVGQDSIEEVDHVAWPWRGLLNFGWDVYEGRASFESKPLGPGQAGRAGGAVQPSARLLDHRRLRLPRVGRALGRRQVLLRRLLLRGRSGR